LKHVPAAVVVSKEEQRSHAARLCDLDADAHVTPAAQTSATEFDYVDRNLRIRGEPFLDLKT
jgi:hypothetical protein